jgi:transposase
VKKTDLPNDIDQLKELLVKANKLLVNQTHQINDLKDIITVLQRKKFAPSSEQCKDQLNFFDEVEQIELEDDTEVEDKTIVPAYERKKRGKRSPLPDSLERVEEVYDLSDEEKEGMRYIGEEVCEKLVIEPANVYVKRIVRKKYAPIKDSNKQMMTAQAPEQLLPKTIASASLLAYIIVSKYVDSNPLYRQEKMFARVKAEISRQSMARWLIQLYGKLLPLYNLLEERLLEGVYLQMDETTVQVLKEAGKKATSKSYMWVRHLPGDQPIVLYDYSPSRSGEVPKQRLDGFKGYLQVDGYDGYSKACRDYELIRLGCFDHVRRKFFDASKTAGGKSIGSKGVKLIDKLYKIEKRIKDESVAKKYEIRNKESKEVLDELKSWLESVRGRVTPKSVAGKAVNYCLNEWCYLENYLLDGKLNMSNILVENTIRPFAIGRKNWLFSASVSGARASAMYYSLIETAKKNDIEPFYYLTTMLEKLPQAKTVDDFEKLLPLKNQFLP